MYREHDPPSARWKLNFGRGTITVYISNPLDGRIPPLCNPHFSSDFGSGGAIVNYSWY